jgi:hypothetical protein
MVKARICEHGEISGIDVVPLLHLQVLDSAAVVKCSRAWPGHGPAAGAS